MIIFKIDNHIAVDLLKGFVGLEAGVDPRLQLILDDYHNGLCTLNISDGIAVAEYFDKSIEDALHPLFDGH